VVLHSTNNYRCVIWTDRSLGRIQKAQINGGYTITKDRLYAGMFVAFGCSVLISWAFVDHLIDEATWFLYARRDGLASCLVCFFMMKNMTKE
jgi:hypothetical protein